MKIFGIRKNIHKISSFFKTYFIITCPHRNEAWIFEQILPEKRVTIPIWTGYKILNAATYLESKDVTEG